MVSDFLLPAWYRTRPSPALAYSHAGRCTQPRQIAPGGYVSFSNPAGEWFQAFNEQGQLQIQDLGRFDRTAHSTLREWTDLQARKHRARAGT